MDRRAVLEVLCRMRRMRDKCRRDGDFFSRGMAAGYDLSARMLWHQLKLERGWR